MNRGMWSIGRPWVCCISLAVGLACERAESPPPTRADLERYAFLRPFMQHEGVGFEGIATDMDLWRMEFGFALDGTAPAQYLRDVARAASGEGWTLTTLASTEMVFWRDESVDFYAGTIHLNVNTATSWVRIRYDGSATN